MIIFKRLKMVLNEAVGSRSANNDEWSMVLDVMIAFAVMG